MPESVSLNETAQPLSPNLEANLHRTDIARIGDDVAEREHAVVRRVMNVAGSHVNEAGTGVDQRVEGHHLVFDRR